MNRKLAKELKAAGFATQPYKVGHRFFPNEASGAWSEAAREHGVTITPYELDNHLQDINEGYYCPSLADLIAACGDRFAGLYLEKTIWTAESNDREKYAIADSPEEALARLWLALRNNNP